MQPTHCCTCGAMLRADNRYCTQCGSVVGLACRACGWLAAPGDRFCGSCGIALSPVAPRGVEVPETVAAAPVAPPAPPPPGAEPPIVERRAEPPAELEPMLGERRRVTILFGDVSGYTVLSERLDPEDVTCVMNELFDQIVPIVQRHEGWVVKTAGDAILVTFGAPFAVEDGPERAVRAALAIQAAIEGFTPRSADVGGMRLRMRIGIHEGDVTAGRIVAGRRHEFDVMGAAVNLSQRLEEVAPVGGVLVSEAVRQRVGESFEFEAVEPLLLRGIAEPVRAFLVRGIRRREARIDRSVRFGLTRMVGRARHLGRLRELLAATEEGRGQLVSIAGEAGAGKSRLALEARGPAQERDFRVLVGQCVSYGRHLPHVPLRELVRGAASIDEFEPDAEQRAKLEALCLDLELDLTVDLPALEVLLDLSGPTSRISALSAEQRAEQVRQSFVRLILALAERQPLLVVLDDIQWLDDGSRGALEALVPLVSERRIALLLLHREGVEPFWSEVANATAIELGRLSDDEALELIADRRECEGMPLALRDRIIARARGNPLFLEELVRAVASRHAAAEGSDPLAGIPESVDDLIMARVGLLKAATRTVLEAASVWASPIQVRVLEQLVGADVDVPRALEELTAAQLLRRHEQREGDRPAEGEDASYEFVHELSREATYRAIFGRRVRELHRRTAEALERLHAKRRKSIAGILAWHYERAGCPSLAIPALAAEIHRNTLDADYARLFANCDRALELLEPLLDEPAYVAVRAQVLAARAWGHARTGDSQAAVADAERSAECASAAGAIDTESIACDRLGYAYAKLADYTRAEEYYRRSGKLAESVDYVAGLEDWKYGMALVLHEQGSYEDAARIYADELEGLRASAARGGAPRHKFQLACLVGLASSLTYLDRFLEALEYGAEAEEILNELARRSPDRADPEAAAYLFANYGFAHFALGRHRRADEYYRRGLEAFERLATRDMQAALRADIARVLVELGQYDRALAEARGVSEAAREGGWSVIGVKAMRIESLALSEIGESTESVSVAERATANARAIGNPSDLAECLLTLGNALRKVGRHGEALETLRAAIESARQAKSRLIEASARVLLGLTHLAAGDLSDARADLEIGLALASELRARLPMGQARLGLGRLALAEGEPQAALVHLVRTVEAAHEMDHPSLAWRAHAESARAHAMLGDQEAALAANLRAVEALRPLLGNRAVGSGPGSLRDRMIELQAAAVCLMLPREEARSSGSEAHVAALLSTGPSLEVLRDHVAEVSSLFDQLADAERRGAASRN